MTKKKATKAKGKGMKTKLPSGQTVEDFIDKTIDRVLDEQPKVGGATFEELAQSVSEAAARSTARRRSTARACR